MAGQTAITDNELVQRFMKGEEFVLEQLLQRHQARIYTSIFVLMKDRDDTDDVFQDTFCKVIEQLRQKKYDERGKFLPWVLRIAHNLCMDRYRKDKKWDIIRNTEDAPNIADLMPDNEHNAEEKMIKNESCALVLQYLDILPEEQREVVVLRHFYEYTFKEIATMTNVNMGTALGRMRYALINLKSLMENKKTRLSKKSSNH
ncbi:MAG: sigma-70 family RNA polymerase sigma factor [Chitinophagales bacterium]|nr:sigma-70 family RNA polymerase sigma factor [Chitinophagales bacterium]